MNLATIVGYVGGRGKGQADEQSAWTDAPASSSEIKSAVYEQLSAVFDLLEKKRDRRSSGEIERAVRGLVFAIGRLLLAFYLARREENSEKEVGRWLKRGFTREAPNRKHLGTFFGRVTFWRTYVRRPGGTGLYPLDRALGLTADGFSLLVMQMAARLSTLLTYEQATGLLVYFLSWSPPETSVEKAVLGFGRHTAEWFKAAPPPEGDGEILVVQFDSKGTPTATEQELEKRRGKRQEQDRPPSPRHRGRAKRKRRGSKTGVSRFFGNKAGHRITGSLSSRHGDQRAREPSLLWTGFHFS